MKPLPPALINPLGGQYPFITAIRVWMHLYYGIEHDADETTPAYKRSRDQAYGDLRPLAKLTKWRQNPVIWFHYHITREDLARFASERGLSLDLQPAPGPNRASAAPTPALVAPVVTLEKALGGDGQQIATGGRPSKNAPAYAYIDSLIAKGINKRSAIKDAAIKFPDPEDEAVDAELRTERLASGYRQRNLTGQNKANKPR